ncbi:MAG: hypothetical protein KG029_12230 [Bacteroidetes bacterium]|nr:hypothetical protein [Bacteroidota bacterium]
MEKSKLDQAYDQFWNLDLNLEPEKAKEELVKLPMSLLLQMLADSKNRSHFCELTLLIHEFYAETKETAAEQVIQAYIREYELMNKIDVEGYKMPDQFDALMNKRLHISADIPNNVFSSELDENWTEREKELIELLKSQSATILNLTNSLKYALNKANLCDTAKV